MGLEPWRPHGSPSMKSVRPKEADRPPEDGDPGDPGDPPAQDAAPQDPSPQPDPERRAMSRPASRSRNAEVDFKGEKRSNATHASTTGPDARLYRKSPGTGAMLCFIGHAVMENRSGLAVQGDLTQASGRAERRAALDMMHRHSPGSTRRLTLGAELPADAPPVRAPLATPMTRPGSRPIAGRPASRRMSRRRRGSRRSTDGPRGTRVTRCRSGTGSASRSSSAGRRRSAEQRKPSIGESSGCARASSSRWQRQTLPGCRGCWPSEDGGRRAICAK